jgi:hypothetical protein
VLPRRDAPGGAVLSTLVSTDAEIVTKKISPESKQRQAMLAIGITDAERWLSRARGLVMAAEEVEPSVRRFWRGFQATKNTARQLQLATGPSTHMAYFMLMGFAAENYLKGLLVAKDSKQIRQEAIKGKRHLVKALGGHDLVEVARKADLEISDSEEELLFRLTTNIEWFGRYPFALTGDRQRAFPTFPDGSPRDIRLKREHIQPVKKLIRRLEKASVST